MKKILITGATGNVGFAVIRFLYENATAHRIVAGVRNIAQAKNQFVDFPELEFVVLDFENTTTFAPALAGIHRVFLLRPPHLSKIKKQFKPFLLKLVELDIRQVVFLSVLGAEKSRVIPHHKIENIILKLGLDYLFLRPGYFMQNLTTTLLNDLQTRREIALPAGEAQFNWIDVDNIAEVAAITLEQFNRYRNRAYEITGLENASFTEVTAILNQSVASAVVFRDLGPLRFFMQKKQDGKSIGFILVMFLLHYLPRFQKEPVVGDVYSTLTGKLPTSLKSFVEREINYFQ